MRAKIGFYGIVLPMLMLGICACVKDQVEPTPVGTTEQLVTFSITVPGAPSSATRSLSQGGEEEIDNIQVLMFKVTGGMDYYDDSKLVYIGYCDQSQITVSGSSRTFTVSLLEEDNVKLVVLANSYNLVYNCLSMGMTYREASEALVMEKDDKWMEANGDLIPMWGHSDSLIDITPSATFSGITLIRMVARIDLILTDVAATSNFTLESVRLYNHYTRGTVMPDVSDWPASNEADKPHLPDEASFSSPSKSDESGVLVFDDATDDGITATALEYAIYTFEAGAGSDNDRTTNTCMVVGGTYIPDGKVYFYRVDFVKTTDGINYDYLDLKRNYQYKACVTAVTGPGYDTPEEALKSAPFNIKAEVAEWADGGMTHFAFDGQNILAASHAEFEFTANEQTAAREHYLYVSTDYSTGWEAMICEKTATGDYSEVASSWLTINKTNGTALYPDARDQITLTATENSSLLERELYIVLTAGRLNLPVRVWQSNDKEGYLLFETLTGDAVTDIIFTGLENDIPSTSQKFRLAWYPADQNISISYYDSYPVPFDKNDIILIHNNLNTPAPTTLTGGGLSTEATDQMFEVKPTTALGSVSSEDDFVEKFVQMEATLTVAGTSYTQRLNVRHALVNIVPDTDGKYFILDGTEQTFNVRSSVQWQISRVVDGSGLVRTFDNSQSGGYNVGTGTPVSITLEDFMTNYTYTEGDVEIYFNWYSKTDQAWYEWGTPAVLKCVTPEWQVAANCYMTDPDERKPIFIPIYDQVKRAMDGTTVETSGTTNGSASLGTTWLLPSSGSKWGVQVYWIDRQTSSTEYVIEDARFSGNNTESISMANEAGIIVMPGNVEGNAVVILFDDANGNGRYDAGDDVIKWSWHIWSTRYHPELADLTDKPASTAENGYVTATGMNGRVHKHHNGRTRSNIFMDRNLGATPDLKSDEGIDFDDVSKIHKAYGLYYQWGRKDPFPGPSAYNLTTDAPIYTKDNNTMTVTKATNSPGNGNNLAFSINNPLQFIIQVATATYDWFTGVATYQHHQLWGSGTDTGNDHTKTVYDPCPPGWRVPLSSTNIEYSAWAREGVTTTTAASYTTGSSLFATYYGYFFDDSVYQLGYYPVAGARLNTTGVMTDTSTYGYYWSASQAASAVVRSSRLTIHSGNVDPTSGNVRANGNSVRCVAE
ncbi:MAG: hypothetical protein LUF87_00755 [Alistipes sp.]|nr:hypothetical protein [Alistipes sp.]